MSHHTESERTKKILLDHGFKGKSYKDKNGESFVGYSKDKKKSMAKKMKKKEDKHTGIFTNGKRDKDQELGKMVHDIQTTGKWIKGK